MNSIVTTYGFFLGEIDSSIIDHAQVLSYGLYFLVSFVGFIALGNIFIGVISNVYTDLVPKKEKEWQDEVTKLMQEELWLHLFNGFKDFRKDNFPMNDRASTRRHLWHRINKTFMQLPSRSVFGTPVATGDKKRPTDTADGMWLHSICEDQFDFDWGLLHQFGTRGSRNDDRDNSGDINKSIKKTKEEDIVKMGLDQAHQDDSSAQLREEIKKMQAQLAELTRLHNT